MTGLKKMIGLPVMLKGKRGGTVMRGVLTADGRSLRGIVMRGGLQGPRWLGRDQIALIGRLSVIATGKPKCAGCCTLTGVQFMIGLPLRRKGHRGGT